MKWAETMSSLASAASLEHDETGGAAIHRAPAASWDPFEVWLTRVKQPRDRIANLAAAGTPDGGMGTRD